jgi:catechol 2,3-dioxygenase-like lactoylglutathione lyase family enzyme
MVLGVAVAFVNKTVQRLIQRHHFAGGEAYDRRAGRVFRGVYRRVAEDVAIAAPAGASVLDAGCGSGRLAVQIALRRPDLQDVVFEDETSVCVRFGRLFVNLLHVSAAHEQIELAPVADRENGSRFQLSIWVEDVDAACALLEQRGATLLTGPVDRDWGMRTATFTDPDGHSWGFPPGPSGAHKIMNRSESPARTLMFSSSRVPAVSVYPDSDKIGVWPSNDADDLVFRRETAVPWSHGRTNGTKHADLIADP